MSANVLLGVADRLGKFALVRLDEVVGVFDTPEEAMIEGFRRFGDERRMVIRTITEQDEVLDITSGFSCEPLELNNEGVGSQITLFPYPYYSTPDPSTPFLPMMK